MSKVCQSLPKEASTVFYKSPWSTILRFSPGCHIPQLNQDNWQLPARWQPWLFSVLMVSLCLMCMLIQQMLKIPLVLNISSWKKCREDHLVLAGLICRTSNVSKCFCSLYSSRQNSTRSTFQRAEAYTMPETCRQTYHASLSQSQISVSVPVRLSDGGLLSVPRFLLTTVLVSASNLR